MTSWFGKYTFNEKFKQGEGETGERREKEKERREREREKERKRERESVSVETQILKNGSARMRSRCWKILEKRGRMYVSLTLASPLGVVLRSSLSIFSFVLL